jgi:hypothetical protein
MQVERSAGITIQEIDMAKAKRKVPAPKKPKVLTVKEAIKQAKHVE